MNQENAYSKGCEVKYLLKSKTVRVCRYDIFADMLIRRYWWLPICRYCRYFHMRRFHIITDCNILMFADSRYADIEKKCQYCRCQYKYRHTLIKQVLIWLSSIVKVPFKRGVLSLLRLITLFIIKRNYPFKSISKLSIQSLKRFPWSIPIALNTETLWAGILLILSTFFARAYKSNGCTW